jgi:hypothetical protein
MNEDSDEIQEPKVNYVMAASSKEITRAITKKPFDHGLEKKDIYLGKH